MPRLPVPALKDTIQRYLLSVRPLFDDNDFERIKKEAEEFENGIAKKLQRYLILKSWWSTNYVSDWWEEYVYLKSRHPIVVNSNIYGTDNVNHPTKIQVARAASLIHWCAQFRRKIIRQELQPILAQGLVPLCSWQYERLFNTTRIPGVDCDKLVHNDDAKHIVILHKGCYYKVPLFSQDRLLNPKEIEYQLNFIVNSNHESSHPEKFLASLTAWDRTKWAETRDKYFSKGTNKLSLDMVESAIFFMHLYEEPYEMDITDNEKMKIYSKQCLFGQINNYWFDKSFCLSTGSNARVSGFRKKFFN